nr:hypothetical protein [Tanacetum cinerariifolium]
MRIEQYFLMTDYSLWEVILNGDSLAPTRVVDGILQPIVPSFVQSTKQVKSPRLYVQHVETSIPADTPKPASPQPTRNGKRRNRKACFVCKSLDHLIKDCDYHEKKMAKPIARNHAHRGYHKPYASMTTQNPQKSIWVKVLENREGIAATRSRDDAPIKRRSIDEGEAATERISDDSEELVRVLTSMDAAIVLTGGIDIPTGSGSIPTAGPSVVDIPIGSDAVPTASLIICNALLRKEDVRS